MERNGRYVTHAQFMGYVLALLVLFGGFFAWYGSIIDHKIDLAIRAAINGLP